MSMDTKYQVLSIVKKKKLLMNKILLTGSRGMVGRNIMENPAVSKWIFLTPSSDELDLTDVIAVDEYLAVNKPDLVIHAAGYGEIKELINYERAIN